MRKMANGTAVAWQGKAVLITGAAGSGKSDLALRLIDQGAELVSDDLVELTRSGTSVLAAFPSDAPPELKGRIEARGVGIVAVAPAQAPAELVLVIEAAPAEGIERIPETVFSQWLDADIPTLRLSLLEASAPTKVRLALGAISGSIIRPS